jgi:hypothetical protein
MRTRLAAIAAALLAAAAIATPVGAVTGNAEKDFVHDYVGLVVFYTDPDPESTPPGDPFSHRCSGTLISPTLVLTAGHCTEGVDHGRMYFEQALGPNYSPDAFGGWGGDESTGYPYEGGHTFSQTWTFGAIFTGYPSNQDTLDVGVLELDEPYTPPSGNFGILPEAGAVEQYIEDQGGASAKSDIRFRTVGYGLLDQDPVPNPGLRERLTAWGYLIDNKDAWTEFQLKTTANASKGKGGSCNGDSGGPVFFEGTRVIAAVVSFGRNGQCKGQDFSYRIDRDPVLDWINDSDRENAG